MNKSMPYDAEIEFLEGTGTQWIDTGIVPTINTEARVKWSPVRTNEGGFFGARDNYTSGRFCCTTFNVGSRFTFAMTQGNWLTQSVSLTLQAIYDCTAKNGACSVNGEVYTTPALSTFNSEKSFLFFKQDSNVQTYYAKMRLYAAHIIENGHKVIDLIPVRVGTTGYMYDKVSGKLFGNAGTEQFILGPDKMGGG